MTYTHSYLSPLGDILLTSDGECLTGLFFAGQRYFPSIQTVVQKRIPLFDDVCNYLDEYFSGKQSNIHIPIMLERLNATPFRIAIFKILLTIPYGKTISYGQAARLAEEALHHRVSARAAGQAVGHNPVSIIIPCHRVIGSDGSLTGYGGGIERKAALLSLEKAHYVTR